MSSNCIASVSIGCLFCYQKCDVDKIRVAFTFLPPAPSYAVDAESEAEHGKMVFVAPPLREHAFYNQAAEHAEVHFVNTSKGEKCPLVWFRSRRSSSGSRDAPLVLLHCHGNATDIGMMMGPYFEMSRQLGIEVVGVEYSGYGMSSGSPNPARTYSDVDAAFDFVVSKGVSPDRVVAYGQSVGSGPASYIASKHQIGGLILHSPLMSGIKVIDPQPDSCCRPSCMFSCCDFYPNDQRLKKATSPTFIIHGQMDDIVPFYHGARLSDMTPQKNRWPGYFPANAGHNDIVESNASRYYQELAEFMRGLVKGPGAPGGIPQEKPLQLEMQPGVVGNRAFTEPNVGPEDGRYAQYREQARLQGGNVGSPGSNI